MNYNIVFTPFFKREFKKLLKRHPSLKTDLEIIIRLLDADPQAGESIGNNCYKIRMAVASKNKGKSGGARIITYVKFVNEEIFLVSIYDKTDLGNISEDELLTRLKSIK